MFPKNTPHDVSNVGSVNPIFLTKFSVSCLACRVPPSYFKNLFRVQFCIPTFLPASASRFFSHIRHVVELCSNAQMMWIATRRVITRMNYKHSIWNRSNCQGKCDFVSKINTAINPVLAVPVFVFKRFKFPTFITSFFIHFCPESLNLSIRHWWDWNCSHISNMTFSTPENNTIQL